mmetsp:Transcript_6222/g.14438  ORF Transcript_6222/g.14438 Transcript_6222/m.14438 type:complete len:331 (+) Transcript_6222:309-1301(+)
MASQNSHQCPRVFLKDLSPQWNLDHSLHIDMPSTQLAQSNAQANSSGLVQTLDDLPSCTYDEEGPWRVEDTSSRHPYSGNNGQQWRAKERSRHADGRSVLDELFVDDEIDEIFGCAVMLHGDDASYSANRFTTYNYTDPVSSSSCDWGNSSASTHASTTAALMPAALASTTHAPFQQQQQIFLPHSNFSAAAALPKQQTIPGSMPMMSGSISTLAAHPTTTNNNNNNNNSTFPTPAHSAHLEDRAPPRSHLAGPQAKRCMTSDGYPSVGSASHDEGHCLPCVFWFRNECRKGSRCLYCHYVHPGQTVKRIRPCKSTRLARRSSQQATSTQ